METFAPEGNIHGPIVPLFVLKMSITSGAKIMYAMLCNHASTKNRCWPSHSTLAKELSCSVSSVKRYLSELIGVKLICSRQEQYRSSVYYMLLPDALKKADQKTVSRERQAERQQSNAIHTQPKVSYAQPKVSYLYTLKKVEKNISPLPPAPVLRSLPPASRALECGGASSSDFEKLWEAYPKKESLEGARAMWRTMWKSGQLPPLPDLLSAIERFMATTQWQKDHGRYIPQLLNFLKYQRWLDPLSPEEEAAKRERLQTEQMDLLRKREEEAAEARSQEKRLRLRPIFEAFTGQFPEEARQTAKSADAMHFGTWTHSYEQYHGPTAADVPDGTTQEIFDFTQAYRHRRDQEAYYAAQSVRDSQSDNRAQKPMYRAEMPHGHFRYAVAV